MKTYIFLLGQARELCLAELTEVLKFFRLGHPSVSGNLAFVQSASSLECDQLQSLLGGTIKIAEIRGKIPDLTAESIVEFMDVGEKTSYTFSLSVYSPEPKIDESLHGEVKALLTPKFSSVRYVLPKNDTLSSVVVTKQRVDEYLLVFDSKEKVWLIAKTVSVQNVESWSKRDFGRPFADPKAGMLPPKVARMMVNLALPESPGATKSLLDPFCGMGTILAEGSVSGWQVVGSDQSAVVVEKARKNLDWLVSEFDLKLTDFKLYVADATHVSKQLSGVTVSAILT